ncbi:MAG: glutathione S-transferase N-terminal domain-containing protein [Pseudomonadota bacterium]
MPLFYPLNVASSLAATCLRGGVGVATRPAQVQPAELLVLYDFEGCPHCRLVREVLTELDLDAQILPCPRGGQRYRPEVINKGGKAQFPYLVDVNTGVAMYESADIIRYLFRTYGQRPLPWYWQAVELQRLFSVLASLPRLGVGSRARGGQNEVEPPALPLELYSFESSPFARPVRDLLCELQLPYILRSVGRSQPTDWLPPVWRRQQDLPAPNTRNRLALSQRTSQVSIPYLIDPNTQTEMAESADIIDYLHETYS